MAISESGSEPSSSQFAELPTSQYQNKQPQREINQDQGKRRLCSSQRLSAGAQEVALPLSSSLVATNPDHAEAFHQGRHLL